MSYIRNGWAMRFVEGDSEDYVFNGVGKDGNDYIEDYGAITDNGIVELLFMHWNTKDTEFKHHLLKRLAKRLNVKLRDTPLTDDELMEDMDRKVEGMEDVKCNE